MIYLTAQAFPPRSGGIENLMGAFAFYGTSAGQEFSVWADGGAKERRSDQIAAHPYSVQRFSGPKPLRRRYKAWRLAQAVTNRPAPIYADSWKSIEHLPAEVSVPVVVYGHGNEFPRITPDGTYPKQARIRKALSKASRMIVVSEQTRQRALPFIPAGLKVEIIHPPVEPAARVSPPDRDFARALWPCDDKIKCVTLCRLIDWKGVDRAIRSVFDTPDAQLVIAGRGGDEARLKAMVLDLGLEGRIKFAGRVEGGRKTALLESADIFLQPGRRVGDQCEGFGISYIEAALLGLPAISGDQGGAIEAVLHGETGWVVNADTAEPVSRAVETLIKDTGMRSQLSRAAQKRAQSLLWPRQIERILAVSGT